MTPYWTVYLEEQLLSIKLTLPPDVQALIDYAYTLKDEHGGEGLQELSERVRMAREEDVPLPLKDVEDFVTEVADTAAALEASKESFLTKDGKP